MSQVEPELLVEEPGKRKLESSRLLARNTALNLATECWLAVVLFANIPLLVKFLGEESFGLFSLAWVVVGYLAFLDIGVSTATTKFTSEYLAKRESDQVSRLVRTALATNSIMGLVAGALAIAIAPFLIQHAFKIPAPLHSQALHVFLAVAFALPVLLTQGVLRATFSSFQRFDFINIVNGSTITVQWLLMTFLAWKGFGVVIVVWVAVLARVAMVISYLILLRRVVPDVFHHLSFCWQTLWRLLHFGAWVSVSQVMSPVLVYFDRMMIAAMVSLSAVTVYTVPTEVFNRLGILPSCLMATLFPALSHHGATGGANGQLSRLYAFTSRYLLFVFFPLFAFLTVNARDIFTVWMGSGFASQGTLVLQILAAGAFVNFLARLPFGAVQALGRPDVTGKFHLLELPIYIALCVLMISRWGITGAALACTMRLWLDSALLFWAAHRYCHLGFARLSDISRILLTVILFILCMLGIQIALHNLWQRVVFSTSLLLVDYMTIWYFVVSRTDKPAILRAMGLAQQTSQLTTS